MCHRPKALRWWSAARLRPRARIWQLSDLIAPIDVDGGETGTEAGMAAEAAATLDLRSEVRRFERSLIGKAIRVHGSKRKAANALGGDIATIVRKTAGSGQAAGRQNQEREGKT